MTNAARTSDQGLVSAAKADDFSDGTAEAVALFRKNQDLNSLPALSSLSDERQPFLLWFHPGATERSEESRDRYRVDKFS